MAMASLSLADLEALLQDDDPAPSPVSAQTAGVGAAVGPAPAAAPAPSPGPETREARARPGRVPAGVPAVAAVMPSLGRQKTFIVENAGILNVETKLAILRIVMMEIGPSVVTDMVSSKEVDIDLDAVSEENEDVITHVYNIVRARLESLSQPARPGTADTSTGSRH
jgi:hypothetical protein